MPSSILPVLKSLFLCDEVLEDPAKGKNHLFGVFNSIRPELGRQTAYPIVLSQMCIACRMAGGVGAIECDVQVVSAESGRTVFYSRPFMVRFPTRTTVVLAALTLRECRFPAPGVYFVEFFADNQFMDDCPLVLQPFEGRLP